MRRGFRMRRGGAGVAAAAAAGYGQGGERNRRRAQQGEGFLCSHCIALLNGSVECVQVRRRAPVCRRPRGDSVAWDRGRRRAARLLPRAVPEETPRGRRQTRPRRGPLTARGRTPGSERKDELMTKAI